MSGLHCTAKMTFCSLFGPLPVTSRLVFALQAVRLISVAATVFGGSIVLANVMFIATRIGFLEILVSNQYKD